MRTPTIVVASDGARAGEATVRWAAREAERRNARLLVAHVLDWDWNMSRYDFGADHFGAARQLAENVAAGAAAAARVVVPAVEVATTVLIGDPAARLLAVAEDADLLVLGSRGHGGFAELLLGSVSQRVATHARCPVVVVRGRADTTTGVVAVGVDNSEAADHVLESAFAAAADRGTGLVAIRSFLPVLPLYYRDVAPETIPTPDQDSAERARLEERLAPWRTKYPDVAVEALLSHDSAAAVLVGVSRGAQLIVVGSRGHGVIVGTLIGSTGLQLLHHSDCPVYLDRSPKERSRQS